ncbi:lupus la ribonucleoprotein [Entamoeba marina]
MQPAALRPIQKILSTLFCNASYVIDDFMFSITNSRGYVTLDIVRTLLLQRVSNVSKSNIVDAIKESDFLELSKDNEKVRRVNRFCFAEAYNTVLKVKCIPTELDIAEIHNYISIYGAISHIEMLCTNNTNSFGGSAIIQFVSPKSVDAIVKAQPRYDDKEVIFRKSRFGCRWFRIKDKEIKIHGVLCILDEENGDTVIEVPKHKESLVRPVLNRSSSISITPTEFLKVKNQFKRPHPTTEESESSTEEQPKPKRFCSTQ